MHKMKFQDPLNVAVITNKNITSRSGWIGYVTHDLEDGGWQFLELKKNEQDVRDAAIVSLGEILEIDPTLIELADLPLGWCAWRKTIKSSWTRKKVGS